MAHTIGVGASSGWSSLGAGGTWRGAGATALVKRFDGSGAKLSTGGGHFWLYPQLPCNPQHLGALRSGARLPHRTTVGYSGPNGPASLGT